MSLNQLTKKNQEFIHIATHQLLADGKTPDEAQAIIDEVLPDIKTQQKRGITARQLLGAPTIWAASFSSTSSSSTEQAPKNKNPWLMWLDTSLLFMALIAFISGVSKSFSSQSPSYGLFSILCLSFGGGAAMYITYYFLYRDFDPKHPTRPPFWKSIGVFTLSMGAWIIAWSLTYFLPVSLNAVLSNAVLLLMGALAFGLRYVLKKKYNIQSAMSPTR